MDRPGRGAIALNGLVKYIVGLGIMALLLFLPAGTINYCGGWRLLVLLFVPMFIFGIMLVIASPDLLARRLKSKEKRSVQSGIIRFSGLMFVVGFVVAGLDFRFGWSSVPQMVIYVAEALFLISYILYAEVMRENEWLSRTIEVSAGQKVVSTGLYGIVRHPMYTATLLLFLTMPLILASWWALAIFALYIPMIVVRIIDEERLLHQELDGYSDYCRRIRWRLLPLIMSGLLLSLTVID